MTEITTSDTARTALYTKVNTMVGECVKKTGNETISGTKTFSSTISGSINGNAATVTNGVYTTGNQTIAGTKTFSISPVVPTPSASDNSKKAATTAYVTTAISNGVSSKANDNAVVHLTNDETIAGTKTFSTSPIVPTPAVSSNTTVPATTAYINTKFQVVTSLPSSPDANTFYFVKE